MIDLKQYRKATSYSRSVQLLGYTVGSVLGQLLVSFNLMSYDNIAIFTLVLTSIALLISLFLPMPQHSMFFHRKHAEQKTTTEGAEEHADGTGDAAEQASGKLKVQDLEEVADAQTCGRVLLRLWRDFLQCYSSRQLLYWSVWWAMATCGYNQTVNYVQVSCEDHKTHMRALYFPPLAPVLLPWPHKQKNVQATLLMITAIYPVDAVGACGAFSELQHLQWRRGGSVQPAG